MPAASATCATPLYPQINNRHRSTSYTFEPDRLQVPADSTAPRSHCTPLVHAIAEPIAEYATEAGVTAVPNFHGACRMYNRSPVHSAGFCTSRYRREKHARSYQHDAQKRNPGFYGGARKPKRSPTYLVDGKTIGLVRCKIL